MGRQQKHSRKALSEVDSAIGPLVDLVVTSIPSPSWVLMARLCWDRCC